jgi:hypothetical protein
MGHFESSVYLVWIALLLSLPSINAFGMIKLRLTSTERLSSEIVSEHHRRTTSLFSSSGIIGHDDDSEFSYETGFVKKNKKDSGGWKRVDNRDALPFVITSFDNGKSSILGTFLLDATTACGDLLDLGGNIYEVKKVTFLYKYSSGGFRVFKKKLDVLLTKAAWKNNEDGKNDDQTSYFQ